MGACKSRRKYKVHYLIARVDRQRNKNVMQIYRVQFAHLQVCVICLKDLFKSVDISRLT
jgi:hypothetical protein